MRNVTIEFRRDDLRTIVSSFYTGDKVAAFLKVAAAFGECADLQARLVGRCFEDLADDLADQVQDDKIYALHLTDGIQRIPLGKIEGDSFGAAVGSAIRRFHSTFKNLVLPQWRIESADGESISVAALRSSGCMEVEAQP